MPLHNRGLHRLVQRTGTAVAGGHQARINRGLVQWTGAAGSTARLRRPLPAVGADTVRADRGPELAQHEPDQTCEGHQHSCDGERGGVLPQHAERLHPDEAQAIEPTTLAGR